MKYALQKVSTVGACDALLASAHKQKQHLERKRRNLGEAIASLQERLNKMNAERVTVQVLLQSFTSAYALLPEGKDKTSLNVSIKRLEVRMALLDKRSLACNAHALLKKQLAYNLLHRQVSAMDSYIAAVHNRRMDLDLFDLRISRMSMHVDSRLSRMQNSNRSAGRRYPGLRSPERLTRTPLAHVFKEKLIPVEAAGKNINPSSFRHCFRNQSDTRAMRNPADDKSGLKCFDTNLLRR